MGRAATPCSHPVLISGLSAGSVPGRQGLRNCIMPGQRGGRGIRTHGDVAATMVFKTIAIGH